MAHVLHMLCKALLTQDGNGLNELLVSYDEKSFTEDTLQAFRNQANKPLPGAHGVQVSRQCSCGVTQGQP